MTDRKHTPGPLFVRQPEDDLYHIQIVNAAGDVIFSEPRHSYSSKMETVDDVLGGYGFPRRDRDDAARANQRQLADAYLRAAAPEMLEALEDAVERQGFTNANLIFARAAIAKARGEE